MKLFFNLTVLACLAISCNSISSAPTREFKTIVSDSLKGRPYNEIDLSRRRAREFNLPEIHKGVDSFELRIWVTSGMISPEELVTLRYSDGQWVAARYRYYDRENTLDSLKMQRINLSDSIGKVVSYLSDPAVLTLPTQAAIPGFVDNVADGQDCTLEISTKTFYKVLSYHCPEHFKEPTNKKFMEIVAFLNAYFHFYALICLPVE